MSEYDKTDFGIYQKALFDRYNECFFTDANGEKVMHIWGLAYEVLDAFADYMATHYGENILAIANAEGYTGTKAEKLQALASQHHDNLAINGDFVELANNCDEFFACKNYKAETYGYKVVLWGVRVNGELI